MKKQIIEAIQSHETIIIHRHVRPDPDAYGSQGGLAEIIKASFPNKKVYRVGEGQESLDYLFVPDTLPDEAWNGALVIVTDTANKERIDDQRYVNAAKVIKIDHHPNREPYGDIVWVDETAAATCEMIYELYLYGKEFGLVCNEEAARLLYAGIVADTGRFLFRNVTRETFAYAGQLIEFGFDRQKLHDSMYEESREVVELSGYILSNYEILPNGVGKIFVPKSVREGLGVSPEDCSRQVNLLGSIKGIKVWAQFTENVEIRVNIRSKGPAINGIAEKYRGGGHAMASGATVSNWNEAEELLKDLVELCEES